MDESSSSVPVYQLEWRERLLKEIVQKENIKFSYFNVLTKDKYSDLILQAIKRFVILNIGSVKKLVARSEDNIKYYIPAEELYDVIDAAHRAMINLYLSMCVTCQEKKTKKKRGLVSKPIHSEMNSMCQVDLIDFQT
ncbi:hypothetical protein RI129_009558 [Pyrocoelia pectoralis]|uniref:Uncharacterized protein n=1 Tax=Pyrocoelia pectoralis TaxID=417401 RepID=A0AAN7V9K4_9COLE